MRKPIIVALLRLASRAIAIPLRMAWALDRRLLSLLNFVVRVHNHLMEEVD